AGPLWQPCARTPKAGLGVRELGAKKSSANRRTARGNHLKWLAWDLRRPASKRLGTEAPATMYLGPTITAPLYQIVLTGATVISVVSWMLAYRGPDRESLSE